MAITPLTATNPLAALTSTASTSSAASTASAGSTAASGGGFTETLRSMLESVDGTTGAANSAVTNMLGGSGDVHEAMIALQRAEMTMQLTVQVRNKLVAAYQDVMRMPI